MKEGVSAPMLMPFPSSIGVGRTTHSMFRAHPTNPVRSDRDVYCVYTPHHPCLHTESAIRERTMVGRWGARGHNRLLGA